jgi:hypothetical protein
MLPLNQRRIVRRAVGICGMVLMPIIAASLWSATSTATALALGSVGALGFACFAISPTPE